jgi:nicotinate-nucleotide pyrophosphorylase
MTTSTNHVFPCASVNGLTLNQKREAIKALRASISSEVAMRREAKAEAKIEKSYIRMSKAVLAEQKMAEKIAKATARLEALQAKAIAKAVGKVGAKAIKANRKPGAVTISEGAEANTIAAALRAKRVQSVIEFA